MECPATCGETKNGADDETITCLTLAAISDLSCERHGVTGLNEIGQISVSNISGDPQDVERIVALKADEQGASWYRIITMYEDQQPDNWRVQAILYA